MSALRQAHLRFEAACAPSPANWYASKGACRQIQPIAAPRVINNTHRARRVGHFFALMPAAGQEVSVAEARAIAKEAYIYGFCSGEIFEIATGSRPNVPIASTPVGAGRCCSRRRSQTLHDGIKWLFKNAGCPPADAGRATAKSDAARWSLGLIRGGTAWQ